MYARACVVRASGRAATLRVRLRQGAIAVAPAADASQHVRVLCGYCGSLLVFWHFVSAQPDNWMRGL
jgi:hypothetical protein